MYLYCSNLVKFDEKSVVSNSSLSLGVIHELRYTNVAHNLASPPPFSQITSYIQFVSSQRTSNNLLSPQVELYNLWIVFYILMQTMKHANHWKSSTNFISAWEHKQAINTPRYHNFFWDSGHLQQSTQHHQHICWKSNPLWK